jgi:hypothetical protein
MAVALAPLVAQLAGPALTSIVGPALAKNLGPLAIKGLETALKSKVVGRIGGKVLSKLGNTFFGKSKRRTARKLLQKGRSIAGVLAGPGSANKLNSILDVGKQIGMVSDDTANSIKTGHEKAMSFHDKLSSLNKSKQS